MSFGLHPCERCHRSNYRDDNGNVKPLEVCRDVERGEWLCKRCYLATAKIYRKVKPC